jgi:hypothetical protein
VYSCNVRQKTLFVQGDPDYVASARLSDCKAELARKQFNTKGSVNDLRERLLKRLPAEGLSRKLYQALRIKRQREVNKTNSTAVVKVADKGPDKGKKRKKVSVPSAKDINKRKKVKEATAKKKKDGKRPGKNPAPRQAEVVESEDEFEV